MSFLLRSELLLLFYLNYFSLLWPALLKAFEEGKVLCFCLFIAELQSFFGERAVCQKLPLETRWAKQRHKTRRAVQNPKKVFSPEVPFGERKIIWEQRPADKCGGQILDFSQLSFRGGIERGNKDGKRAYLPSICGVSLLAHRHTCRTNFFVWQPLWDEWQRVEAEGTLCVPECVCVCVLLGRGACSEIPQRNQLLGLSMLQQPITVSVCVWVWGLKGRHCHKMEGTSPNHRPLAPDKGKKTARTIWIWIASLLLPSFCHVYLSLSLARLHSG